MAVHSGIPHRLQKIMDSACGGIPGVQKRCSSKMDLTGAMMGRVAFWILFLSFCASLHAGSPVVTNVIATQRADTKLVDISYDVFDSDNDPLKVRVEISANGGRTFDVPAITLSGDIGGNVSPGTSKQIVWNAGLDWDGEYSPEMRVKIIASDGHGVPEMAWGTEVAAGGFLLGQDGGPEGAGPSRHVVIPWSYWVSKCEVTIAQYVDFLNMGIAAGEVYRDATKVYAQSGRYIGVPGGAILMALGPDIQWSISRFVPTALSNLPVLVTWHGAVAYAEHYGYDLPTEAEWEKAARGADYDGAGEHRNYPWGNGLTGSAANFSASGDPFTDRTPVGYFNGGQMPAGGDMTNAYGLYDVSGNVAEWTRTSEGSIEVYPQMDALTNTLHALTTAAAKVIRGGSYADTQASANLKCHGRVAVARTLSNGFRVVRRQAPERLTFSVAVFGDPASFCRRRFSSRVSPHTESCCNSPLRQRRQLGEARPLGGVSYTSPGGRSSVKSIYFAVGEQVHSKHVGICKLRKSWGLLHHTAHCGAGAPAIALMEGGIYAD